MHQKILLTRSPRSGQEFTTLMPKLPEQVTQVHITEFREAQESHGSGHGMSDFSLNIGFPTSATIFGALVRTSTLIDCSSGFLFALKPSWRIPQTDWIYASTLE